MENKSKCLNIEVNHHEYARIARDFVENDLEYIRRRVNANRNIRNDVLTSKASRTYESVKTLIDILEILYQGRVLIYEMIPIKTVAEIDEENSAEVTSEGIIANTFLGGSMKLITNHKLTTSFTRYPSGKEVYTVVYDVSFRTSEDEEPTHVSWSGVYPVSETGILGYSENLPAPSVLAGEFAKQYMIAVSDYIGDDAETDEDENDGSDSE